MIDIERLNRFLEDLNENWVEDLGFPIMIDGKQYQISPFGENPLSCYIGEPLVALSEVSQQTLLELVRENPHNDEAIEALDGLYHNVFKACVWLRGQIKVLYGEIVAELIFTHFIKEIELFDIDQDEYFQNFDMFFLDEAEITLETFKGTRYSRYGGSDTGHFMLSAFLHIRMDLNQISSVLLALSESNSQGFGFLFERRRQPDIRYQIVKKDSSLCSIYGIKDIYSMIIFDVHQIITQGVTVKTCKNRNCGKFFIPRTRSDTLYCSRPSPQEESLTCQEYASKKLWYEKLKANELAKLSRNVYTAKQMLVRRHPDIKAYADMFEHFKEERQRWVAAVTAGEKSPEEYTEWLNQMKKKKVL